MESAVGAVGYVILDDIAAPYNKAGYDQYELTPNVRSGPGLGYAVVGTLRSGNSFEVLESYLPSDGSDGYLWHRIKLMSGATVYIAADFVEIVDDSRYRAVPVQVCPPGQATLGITSATTEVFAEADMASWVQATLPRGNSVKILSADLQQRYVLVEYPEFDPEFHRDGPGPAVEARTGYMLRAHLRISNSCRDWGLAMMQTVGTGYLKASNVYISRSPEYRRTNISLASVHLDGNFIRGGEAFSYCEAITPPFMYDDGAPSDYDGSPSGDVNDRRHCPPGTVLNKWTQSCGIYVHGHGTAPGSVVAWGGACGSASAVFRAAYRGGFPIHRKHDHGTLFRGLYDYPHYGNQGGGTDAEVYCDLGNNPAGFEFGNDGADSLVIVSGTRLMSSQNAIDTYGVGTGVTGGDEHFHTFVHVYGQAPVDRQVSLHDVERPGARWVWSRDVDYSVAPITVNYLTPASEAAPGWLQNPVYSTDAAGNVHMSQSIWSSY